MGFLGFGKSKEEKEQEQAAQGVLPKEKVKVEVVGAGKEPTTIEGESDWTVEDYLVEANLDADKVQVDGREAGLQDTVAPGTKRIIAVPNVKGGN